MNFMQKEIKTLNDKLNHLSMNIGKRISIIQGFAENVQSISNTNKAEITDSELTITEMDLQAIETEQSLTDLDLRVMELEGNVNE